MPVTVVHPITAPAPLPRLPAHPNAVQNLFAFQADGQHAGHFQPISGAEAQQSYQAYLKASSTHKTTTTPEANNNALAASSAISGSQYPGMQP
jgi:hypothetical protein